MNQVVGFPIIESFSLLKESEIFVSQLDSFRSIFCFYTNHIAHFVYNELYSTHKG